jgi:hypothetical protein
VSGTCKVCSHQLRNDIDRALAEGYSPAWLARNILNLSKKQLKHHRNVCMEGDPLRVLAEEMGYELIDEPEQDPSHRGLRIPGAPSR